MIKKTWVNSRSDWPVVNPGKKPIDLKKKHFGLKQCFFFIIIYIYKCESTWVDSDQPRLTLSTHDSSLALSWVFKLW